MGLLDNITSLFKPKPSPIKGVVVFYEDREWINTSVHHETWPGQSTPIPHGLIDGADKALQLNGIVIKYVNGLEEEPTAEPHRYMKRIEIDKIITERFPDQEHWRVWEFKASYARFQVVVVGVRDPVKIPG